MKYIYYIMEISHIETHPSEEIFHGPYETEEERDSVAKKMRGNIATRDIKSPRFYRINMEQTEEEISKLAA